MSANCCAVPDVMMARSGQGPAAADRRHFLEKDSGDSECPSLSEECPLATIFLDNYWLGREENQLVEEALKTENHAARWTEYLLFGLSGLRPDIPEPRDGQSDLLLEFPEPPDGLSGLLTTWPTGSAPHGPSCVADGALARRSRSVSNYRDGIYNQ